MPPPDKRTGETQAEIVPGDVLRIRFAGHVTGRTVERSLTLVRPLLTKNPKGLFIDAVSVGGFDADVRAPGLTLLQTLRDAGLRTGTAAVPSSAVRMIGSALAFASGLPLEFLSTYDEALTRAKALAAGRR